MIVLILSNIQQSPLEEKMMKASVIQNNPYVPNRKYVSLYQENPDFVGWLKIENTSIDYPVMKSDSDPDKYIDRDFYGNKDPRGSLFMDPKSDISRNSSNMLIYGHNMKDGSMFFDLLKFQEEVFAENNEIYFETLSYRGVYEVFSVFQAEIGSSFGYYEYVNLQSEEDFREYIDNIQKNAIFFKGEVSYGDELLTLSTCSYHVSGRNGRFVVVARRKDDI